jgi:hypothetical protein
VFVRRCSGVFGVFVPPEKRTLRMLANALRIHADKFFYVMFAADWPGVSPGMN